MTWFRVDDVLADHPKVLMAGNAAMGLWVRAGAWSMRHLTEGFIPSAAIPSLGTPEEAETLVEVGLWLITDGGYKFHAWDGRQPSKQEVEERRRVRSEAGRKGGVKSGESKREATAKANAEANWQAESNPVPSRPVPDGLVLTSHSQSHQGNAHANETDGLNIGRVRTAVGKHLGILDVPSVAELEALAADLIARAPKKVRSREAYIEGCDGESVRAAWDRVQSIRASIAASLGEVA